MNVAALSYAAWASATFEAHRLPPDRNGTPSRRASAAITYRTRAGSGVPNVGAPDCIEIDDAKDPRITGAPGRTSCTNAMPASASASVWAAVPATVTGDIAPARMNGVMRVAWFACAYTRATPSIVASHTSGEFALIRLRITVWSSR